jgi:hypothetical protein
MLCLLFLRLQHVAPVMLHVRVGAVRVPVQATTCAGRGLKQLVVPDGARQQQRGATQANRIIIDFATRRTWPSSTAR